jgi:hypothetical protein
MKNVISLKVLILGSNPFLTREYVVMSIKVVLANQAKCHFSVFSVLTLDQGVETQNRYGIDTIRSGHTVRVEVSSVS